MKLQKLLALSAVMNSRPDLKIAGATYGAAKYACERWHYSGQLPMPPMIRLGVWENSCFIGVVIFSRGASPHLLDPYGLKQTEGCELTRVALKQHATPVTRIVAIAIRHLRKTTTLKLIVSFADPAEGHHGGIYQGGNWIYTGMTKPSRMYWDGTRWLHQREATSKRTFGQNVQQKNYREMSTKLMPGKHRYLFPLCDELRERLLKLAQPYPKRARSADSGTSGDQPGRDGAIPIRAL